MEEGFFDVDLSFFSRLWGFFVGGMLRTWLWVYDSVMVLIVLFER